MPIMVNLDVVMAGLFHRAAEMKAENDLTI